MVLFKAPNVIPGFVDPADTAQAFTEDGWPHQRRHRPVDEKAGCICKAGPRT